MKGWDPEWRCFSLVLKDRTVDFACLDESDTIACILGLQSAVRGPKGYTLLELRRHINRIKAADDNTKAIASLKPWGRSTMKREADVIAKLERPRRTPSSSPAPSSRSSASSHSRSDSRKDNKRSGASRGSGTAAGAAQNVVWHKTWHSRGHGSGKAPWEPPEGLVTDGQRLTAVIERIRTGSTWPLGDLSLAPGPEDASQTYL